jgi:chemotaxis protein histidine kinase CheA
MNERKYLIEILLRARENISQAAQKAARALDDVTKAQDRTSDSAKRVSESTRQQITALEQLREAHVREKKALDESAAVFRFRANASKAAAEASRGELEELQRLARVERATAAEREARTREQVTQIRRQVAERTVADATRNRAYKDEVEQLRKQAALIQSRSRTESASNRRRAEEQQEYLSLAKEIVSELQARSRTEAAVAAEREKRDIEEVTRLRRQVAERNAAEGTRDKAYSAETNRLSRQAALIDARAKEEAAANRRRTAEIGVQIDNARKELQQLQAVADAERELNSERERRSTEQIARIRQQVAEREAAGAKQDAEYRSETDRLRNQATVLEAQSRTELAASRKRAAALDIEIANRQQSTREAIRSAVEAESTARVEERAHGRVSRALKVTEDRLARMVTRSDDSGHATTRFGQTLERLGLSSQGTSNSLRGLNAEFQGFQLALVIKYAQSLVTVLVGLAGQLVAVAAAAGQAAAGIAGALAAGAAQAVPVIGVLAASFARLTSVLKAVKQQNQQQLTASHDAQAAAGRQRAATDQIRNAEERVADAHRNTARAVEQLAQTRSDAARQEVRAQEDVTRARKDAIRTVQDLMAAEEDAIQTLEGARATRRQAIASGDVLGAVQADIGVRRARTGLQRARQDAAPVRARGVEGVPALADAEQRLADVRQQGSRQVVDAERRIADARRDEQRASEDLANTRRTAAENLDQETAAADKLTDMLAQLSPAERDLYRRILELQNVYRRVARPITDIITRSFTGVVDTIIARLRDPRIIAGFRGIATALARSIRTATREAGGPRSVDAFTILSAEAARNIPIATRILTNFFRAVRNLVLDALPAFRLLLSYVEDYSGQALDASRNSRGIRDFFLDGVRYAKSFFELGLAVVRLLLAIAGPGGAAAEGDRTIRDLTDTIDGLTEKVRDNAGQVREFFAGTRVVLDQVLRVLGAVGTMLIDAFDPGSVKAFADFLVRVIIPAVGSVIKIMGFLAQVFHQLFSLPGFSEFAQFAVTVLLLAKGLTIIRLAIIKVLGIVPEFLRAMGLIRAGITGITAVTTGGWIALAIMAVVAAVLLLDRKFHFLGPTFTWLKRVGTAVWDAIKDAAQGVIDWFSDVWTQGLLKWIRWPFVWLAQHIPWRDVWDAIVTGAKAVIDFFKGDSGGTWGAISRIITSPFRKIGGVFKTIFDTALTIIDTFLDLVAGRFDEVGDTISGFWDGVLDTFAGAASSMLDILEKLLSAFGKLPKVGGPFRDAAEAIGNARDGIDKWRESLRGGKDDSEKANEENKRTRARVKDAADAYEDARKKQHGLKKGTDDYRDAARRTRERQKDLNTAVGDLATKSTNARGPVRTLKRNVQNLGATASTTAQQVIDDLNDALKGMGARPIKVRVHRTAPQQLMNSDNPLLGPALPGGATGGVLSRASGLRRRLWGGGVPNPYGGAGDDHLLFSPTGYPVAALSGTEGIVNTPQMREINNSLAFSQAMGASQWGSLNDLWGSGMRHYQAGGGLKPAIRQLSNRLDRMFGLQTTSTTEGQHARDSYHYQGLAADVSGSPAAMARASRYLMTSGIWKGLLEGIHNPNLSVKNGQRVPPSFWGASTWGDHLDHIHLALRSMAGRFADMTATIRPPRITGPAGPATDMARAMGRLTARAANRYLNRALSRMGGGDTRALGADANVVSAFRRAIRTLHLNRTEQLALWEAGIVESGLKNLPYGDRDSLGSLQERTSIFGRGHAMNPYASALRFGRDAISKRPWRGTAGALAQAVQRSAFPGRYDQERGRAIRYLQTGGPVKGTTRRPAGPPAAGLANMWLRGALGNALERINGPLADVAETLLSVARGPLRRSKRLALRIERAFGALTEENGILDQLHTAVSDIAARGARQLQRRQFAVGRGGPRRLLVSDADVAAANLQTLQSTRTGLEQERDTIQGNIGDAQRALSVARRRNNAKAEAAARAALTNLRTRLNQNTTDLVQNAQDQVETQEAFQQALLQSVTTHAEQQTSAIERWSRLAAAFGQRLNPNAVLDAQMANMRQQIGGLQGVLNEALRTGNLTLATDVRGQIDELNVQIAEAVAQQFQNAIDAVNTEAERQTGRLDRAARRAQIGTVNYAALGDTLTGRQNVLGTQRVGLAGPARAGAGGGQRRPDRQPHRPDRRARHRDGREHAGHPRQHRRRLQRAHPGHQRPRRVRAERLHRRAGLLPGLHRAHRHRHADAAAERPARAGRQPGDTARRTARAARSPARIHAAGIAAAREPRRRRPRELPDVDRDRAGVRGHHGPAGPDAAAVLQGPRHQPDRQRHRRRQQHQGYQRPDRGHGADLLLVLLDRLPQRHLHRQPDAAAPVRHDDPHRRRRRAGTLVRCVARARRRDGPPSRDQPWPRRKRRRLQPQRDVADAGAQPVRRQPPAWIPA